MKMNLLVASCLFVGSISSANNITGANGTFSHGSSVTVTGTSFGSKGGRDPNKPLVWADFEASINPTQLGLLSSWDGIQNLSRSSSSLQSGNSIHNVFGTFGTSMSFNLTPTGGVKTLYLYGKRYYTAASLTGNQKFFRIWNDQGGDTVASTSNDGIILDEYCIPAARFQQVVIPTQVWNQHEFLWRQSTAGSCSGLNSTGNGYYEFIQNGVRQQAFVNNFPTEISAVYGSPSGNGLRIMDNFTDESGIEGTSVYMDDIYVDDTFARVMIGNAATFAASTVREIQVPTAWADGSITISINRGTFPNSAKAWLYVIDKNNIPSNGFPITFGGGTTLSKPNAPKNLNVR